jgi:hypothetical protein
MFDPRDFEHGRVPIRDTYEPIPPDMAFLEEATGERVKIVARITPLVIDDFVEFRDDPVLSMVLKTVELAGGR